MANFFEKGKTFQIPLEQIDTGFYELRESVGGERFEELKQSMSEQGQLLPIVVEQYRGEPDPKFKLFIGNRRYQAAKDLGWDTIWATPIQPGDDFSMVAKALVENLQRKDLAPLEEARAIAKMKEAIIISGDDLSADYIAARTQEEIGRALCKSQAYVSDSLQIAGLKPEEIAQLSDSDKLKKDKLLRVVRQGNRAAKSPDKRREKKPIHYEFKRDRLKIRVDFDLKTGDRQALISTLQEILNKLMVM